MNENEKEQMYEITGWYAAHDDDVVMKVDRCIHLGRAWHYHVLIDADGDETDGWYADYEHNDECPGIYETKEQAEERVKLEKEAWKNREQAIQKKQDEEDAPLVEKLSSLGPTRVNRMLKRAFSNYSFVHSSTITSLREDTEILEILSRGGIYLEIGSTTTFFPLGSIVSVSEDGKKTTFSTKDSSVHCYGKASEYATLKGALSIYNQR